MTDQYAIDITACRARQQRLWNSQECSSLDSILATRTETVQWLTGAWVPPFFRSMAVLNRDGETVLVVPESCMSENFAADRVVSYPAQRLATICDEQSELCGQALIETMDNLPQNVGTEAGTMSQHLADSWPATWKDVSETVLRLRRRKDPDEVVMLNRANKANRRMYEHARETLRPGINELEVYNQLSAVATTELGETPMYFGQDFQCCSMGGPPRNREAQTGELYILDLGVGFRGYRSDNCRTFCVGAEPDPKQQQAWEILSSVFPLVESTVRPGVSCRDLYHQVNDMLLAHTPWQFGHHLGHGVGLFGHEGPRLNPNYDDIFEEGNFFTVEPGLYHEELRFGIRLEQNYLVTSNGVDLLTDWPLEL